MTFRGGAGELQEFRSVHGFPAQQSRTECELLHLFCDRTGLCVIAPEENRFGFRRFQSSEKSPEIEVLVARVFAPDDLPTRGSRSCSERIRESLTVRTSVINHRDAPDREPAH